MVTISALAAPSPRTRGLPPQATGPRRPADRLRTFCDRANLGPGGRLDSRPPGETNCQRTCFPPAAELPRRTLTTRELDNTTPYRKSQPSQRRDSGKCRRRPDLPGQMRSRRDAIGVLRRRNLRLSDGPAGPGVAAAPNGIVLGSPEMRLPERRDGSGCDGGSLAPVSGGPHLDSGRLAAGGEPIILSGESIPPSGERIIPSGEPISQRGEPIIPGGESISPSGGPIPPRGNSISPGGEPIIPRDKSIIPSGEPIIPRGKSISPRGEPVLSPGSRPRS